MKIHHRAHNSSASKVRVWKEGWVGDQFEIIGATDFAAFQRVCLAISIELVEHTDDEDDNTTEVAAETYPQGSAQQWVEAFKSGNTAALCIVLADQFDCRDDSTADDYDVMCFLDGSKAGWKRSGDAWLICGPTS